MSYEPDSAEIGEKPRDTDVVGDAPRGGLRRLHHLQGGLSQQARSVRRAAVPHIELRPPQLIDDVGDDRPRRTSASLQRPRLRDAMLARLERFGDVTRRDAVRDRFIREEERTRHTQWIEDQLLDGFFVGLSRHLLENAAREYEPRVVVMPDLAERCELRDLR
jgi:hypothetical protein